MTKTISDLLEINRQIYGVPDDRLLNIEEFFYYQEKYILRYLDDQSKNKVKDAKEVLIITSSWFLAFINRMQIDLEEGLKKRYPYKCPYCLEMPCYCDKNKEKHSQKTGRPTSLMPKNLPDWQKLIAKIYPDNKQEKLYFELLRKLDSLHFTVRNFRRRLVKTRMKEVRIESVDYFVLLLRLFNLLGIDFTKGHLEFFKNGCFVCHKIPCECYYFE
jgi:hypothetical protein